jgi:VRR-NUC domain
MGTRRGWPDFQIFQADDRVCFLELKRQGGRLSEDQQRIAGHLRRGGQRFEVVDSLEAAIAILKGWGAVRAGISVQ